MALNRLYVVNTETKEYCVIAKCFGSNWNIGNVDIFDLLLKNTNALNDETNLIIGSESDNDFFDKWIKDGININAENKWNYYKENSK